MMNAIITVSWQLSYGATQTLTGTKEDLQKRLTTLEESEKLRMECHPTYSGNSVMNDAREMEAIKAALNTH